MNSSSPFELFRRHLKPMMVVLTLLALFAFVVLPALQTYLQQNVGTVADTTLASYDGVELKQSRVDHFTRNHAAMVRFLTELAEETIRRGGAPRTPGFSYDTQTNTIQSIGIDPNPSQPASVRTLQYSAKASDAGFELDDTAIATWLSRFTDGTMSDGEIIALLMQSTRNQMGKYHLYDQLRHHLLAELYQRGALVGIVDGQLPVVTPVEQWENFLKLNRQATATTYAVMVQDYIDQTEPNASAAEIREVYEEGKDRFPDDQSPEPGFRRRETATFEYLSGDLQSFIDRGVDKFSEEQLRAEYERRLAGGDFQLPAESPLEDVMAEDPTAEPQTPGSDRPSAEAEPAADPPASTEPGAEGDKADAPAMNLQQPGSDSPADSPAGDEAPADEPPSNGDPDDAPTPAASPAVEEQPAPESETPPAPESETPPADEAPDAPEDAPQEDSSSRSRPLPGGVRLVALQDEDAPPAEDAPAEDAPAEDAKDEDAKDEPADAPPVEEQPAVEEASPAGDGEAPMKDAPPSEPSPSDEAPAETTPADDAPAQDPPAEKMPAEETATEQAPAAPAEPKIEPFESVRDRIADELAAPEAREKLDAALTEAANVMRRYFNQKSIYDGEKRIGKDVEKPQRPDLKQVAEELGLTYEQIGPHNALTISEEPIADSFEVGTEQFRRGPAFPVMMFGIQNNQMSVPKQQLFSPLRTADDQTNKHYVSWKIDEKEAHTPELEEIRDEVVTVIRTRKARELAREAAEAIAKQANEAPDRPLAEIVPEDKREFVQEDLGPFTWMNSFGFGRATIGNVPQLDSVGPRFMRAVFTHDVGVASVAPNQPERVYYVVRPTSFQPPIEELRRRFLQPQERMMAMLLGNEEAGQIIRGFYQAVDDRMDFQYNAPEAE